MARGKGCPPYKVGWDPDWLESWVDKTLTWPTWDYERKAEALADAKAAAKHSAAPVVVYDGKLKIVGRFEPRRKDPMPPRADKELIERLRQEAVDAPIQYPGRAFGVR